MFIFCVFNWLISIKINILVRGRSFLRILIAFVRNRKRKYEVFIHSHNNLATFLLVITAFLILIVLGDIIYCGGAFIKNSHWYRFMKNLNYFSIAL